MKPSERAREAISGLILLIVFGAMIVCCLYVLLFTAGCAAHSEAVKLEAGKYEIPVQHETIEAPAGWENEPAIAEITVPPSATETVIHVRPKHRTLAQKVFPSRKQTTVEAVASSPGVKVSQQPETPWWWWALIVLAVLCVAGYVLRSYMGPVWTVIKKLFGK